MRGIDDARWRGIFVLWMIGLVVFPVATLVVLFPQVPALAFMVFGVNIVVEVRMFMPSTRGEKD